MSEAQVYTSRQNKYYHEIIKADPEKYAKEREKVRTILKNRYHNDEEYKHYICSQIIACCCNIIINWVFSKCSNVISSGIKSVHYLLLLL